MDPQSTPTQPPSPLVAPDVEAYAASVTTPQPDRLVELERSTRASLSNPQMLSGPVVGRLLEMLVHATGAQRVLEIGTYSGYSALAMAAALRPGGRIVTLEADAHHAEFARRAFAASPFADRIELIEGPAAETLAGLQGPFEVVFIDADKDGYPHYVELTLPMLAEHGVIALDNTLRGGHVLDSADGPAATMDELNRSLASDPRLLSVMLTVRDGVTLVRRRNPGPE
jgi:caffeoyl-CoA O-methyltransferase